jgi:hypothetical protein
MLTREAGAGYLDRVACLVPGHPSRRRPSSRNGAASVRRRVSSSAACSGSQPRSACPPRGGGSRPGMPMTRRRRSSASRRRTRAGSPPRLAVPGPSLRAAVDPDRWPWIDHLGSRTGSPVAARALPRVDGVRSGAISGPRCLPTTGLPLRSTSSCRTAAACRWVRRCHPRRPNVVDGARSRPASRRLSDRHS